MERTLIFHDIRTGSRLVDIASHPAAEVFPLLEGAELEALRDDIATYGLRQKPVLDHRGELLVDGRNRLLACQALGVSVEFDRLGKGEDEVAFVVSANLQRRHLNESQRAMAAARVAVLRQGEKPRGEAVTQARVAITLAVGERSVQRARRVLENGDPALIAAVDRGRIRLKHAEVVVELPAWQQRDIANDPSRLSSLMATRKEADDVILLRRFKEAAQDCIEAGRLLVDRRLAPPSALRRIEQEITSMTKHAQGAADRNKQ